MQEGLSINVRLALKDLRAFSMARINSGIHIVRLILCILITFLMLTGIVIAALSFSDAELKQITVIMATVILIMAWVFYLLPMLSLYMRLRTSFIKSKLLRVPVCYKVFADRLEIWSENDRVILQWNEIYMVQEFRPCFAIQSVPGMIFLVPKRCFASQAQLDLFINILELAGNKKKIKLKKYRLRDSRPAEDEIAVQATDARNRDVEAADRDIYAETGNIETGVQDNGTRDRGSGGRDPDSGEKDPDPDTETEGLDTAAVQSTESEDEQEKPVLEVEYKLLKKEYMNLSYRLYYTGPGGLIITAFGLVLTALSIRGFLLGTGYPGLPLALGLFLVLYPPLIMFVGGNRHYLRNSALQKPRILKFHNDHFVVVHPAGTSKIRYSDLVKIREAKTAVLLYVTDRLMHIIPKRVFEGREDELEALRDLLRSAGMLKGKQYS
jgi:hypothetical protein